MKRAALLGLISLGSAAWAQADGAAAGATADNVAALRELLSGGYYALAAQVEGPRVVEAQPQNAEAHLLYARALLLTGNVGGAAAALEQAITEQDSIEENIVTDIAHLDALVRAEQGDTEGARELLARTFEASPSYTLAMDWGRVAWQGGRLGEAARAYREAMTIPGGAQHPWPTLNLARLQLLQGDFGGAIESLNTTLDILEDETGPLPSPAYIEAFYRLGEAHEALGELEQAVSNYQAARSSDPDYALALDALDRLDTP